MPYNHQAIEKKWQEYWEQHRTFCVTEDRSKQKLYVLDMYPYPSGAGLHVGHPEGYTATDIYCRYKRMMGFNVLHPMGWDAFGLPAERYAMQTGIHPRITTEQNIGNFRRQIKMLGLSYDWSREVNTTDPGYYKWTQWIFLRLYHSWFDETAQKARPINEFPLSRGLTDRQKYETLSRHRLAYLEDMPVNWCPELGTVLANEEVAEWTEKGYTVERRLMRQWMLRITAYAERLENDLNGLNWPSGIIEMQRNWIGRSEGAEIDFPVPGGVERIRVFTTRPDTIFGATYMVLAPEDPLVRKLTLPGNLAEVEAYLEKARRKSDLERTALDKAKTGIFTGGVALNPASGAPIPVWIADYVLPTYGTGAIMAVPGHDQRDFEFARQFGLPITEVVKGGDLSREPFEGEGIAVNSRSDAVVLDGLPTSQAKEAAIKWVQDARIGKRSVHYKLRDWLFSRQRYWGEPFPLAYREDGTVVDLPEDQLPVPLPDLESFQPSGGGGSALAGAGEWLSVKTTPGGETLRRETHTMPQWAGSCWYYLRYLDPHNDSEFVSREKERYWMPVDLYIGGAEHAVLHLLYARFWHKVLYDLGYVSTKEPFARLVNQGTILGEDGQKMSKSRGNVINPDDIVLNYGADSIRLIEMFMGPLIDTKPWSTRGVEGVHRFLNRVWRMLIDEDGHPLASIRDVQPDSHQDRLLHQTIKKVTLDIEALAFNTAISQLMIFVNEFLNAEVKPRKAMDSFVLLLSPFAPHIAEELWEKLGHRTTLAYEPWPAYDEAKTKVDTVEIVVQINGKVRTKFPVPLDTEDSVLKEMAQNNPQVRRYIDGKQITKLIVVKNRMVSIAAT